MVVDRTKLKFYSPDPIDKITADFTGSMDVSAGGNTTVEIAHGLSYIPLCLVKWSTSSTFDVSYDEGISGFLPYNLVVRSDLTTIYILGGNNDASPITLYYRIIAFMPTDVDLTAPASTATLDEFAFNSDYNYSKVFEEGVIDAATGTVEHNLGYYPQVEAWYIRGLDGQCVHAVEQEAYASPSSPTVTLTTSALTFGNGASVTATKWHYKIYWDEF